MHVRVRTHFLRSHGIKVGRWGWNNYKKKKSQTVPASHSRHVHRCRWSSQSAHLEEDVPSSLAIRLKNLETSLDRTRPAKTATGPERRTRTALEAAPGNGTGVTGSRLSAPRVQCSLITHKTVLMGDKNMEKVLQHLKKKTKHFFSWRVTKNASHPPNTQTPPRGIPPRVGTGP